jgi:hypothetical protein
MMAKKLTEQELLAKIRDASLSDAQRKSAFQKLKALATAQRIQLANQRRTQQ